MLKQGVILSKWRENSEKMHGLTLWTVLELGNYIQYGRTACSGSRAIFSSSPAILVKCPPCLSWHVAIDETEISGDLGRSISASVDALSELRRYLYCLGLPSTAQMASHSALRRTGAVTAMAVI